MAYIFGCILPVPLANRAAYLEHVRDWAPRIKEMGATRHLEAWGVDIHRGAVNDLWRGVRATEEETVCFAFIEYPDKAAADAAQLKMEAAAAEDPALMAMPFDGMRMAWGGFASPAPSAGARPGFIDGMLVPAPAGAAQALRAFDAANAARFAAHGALKVVTCWPEDVPHGEQTDLHATAAVREGEVPLFGWIEWPDRATRDAAWAALMQDPGFHAAMEAAPYDMQRMAAGGFEVVADS